MNCDVRVDNAGVTLSIAYDVRAFLDFYRNQADEATKALLFEAAIPCCFCISDKCTTLLTDRRIALGSKVADSLLAQGAAELIRASRDGS